MTVLLALQILPGADRSATSTDLWIAAGAGTLLFFVSLLAHEFHAIMARRHGRRRRAHALGAGGMAKLTRQAPTLGQSSDCDRGAGCDRDRWPALRRTGLAPLRQRVLATRRGGMRLARSGQRAAGGHQSGARVVARRRPPGVVRNGAERQRNDHAWIAARLGLAMRLS
ncbi:MAG: hypothetical protein R2710_15720 [Acidimicrobiales bacterium]